MSRNAKFQSIFAGLLVFFSLLGHTEVLCETKVGVIVPYSGDFAKYGELIRKGVKQGSGPNVVTVYEDEQCEPMPAVRAYKKLSQVDEINIFYGPACGSPQNALAPLLRANKHLAVLGNAASEVVFELSGGRMFSAQHSLEAESRFLARQMNLRGIESVVLVFRDTEFSRSHESAFRSVFKGKILQVVTFSAPDDSGAVKAAALQVKKLKPEAIFSPDATPFFLGLTRQLRGIGVGTTPVWSVYGTQTESVLGVVKGDGVPIIYSYPDIGARDALEYFPTQGMKMISAAAKACEDDTACAMDFLQRNYKFDKHGALQGDIVLKTIHDGEFIRLD